jgi:hypothetical protein
MGLPSRQFGYPLLADRTSTLLFSPQKQQHFEPFERPFCFNIEALLKVSFPMRIIGIGFTFDFGVPADGSVGEAIEPDLPCFSTYSHFTAKDPVAIADGMEIFLLDPLAWFVRMATTTPLPQRFEDRAVHFLKGLFTCGVLGRVLAAERKIVSHRQLFRRRTADGTIADGAIIGNFIFIFTSSKEI